MSHAEGAAEPEHFAAPHWHPSEDVRRKAIASMPEGRLRDLYWQELFGRYCARHGLYRHVHNAESLRCIRERIAQLEATARR